MFNVKGKVALVTGGTSGIGLATARRLADAGARVAVVGRRSNGATIAEAFGARFFCADVTREDELLQALDGIHAALGPLDAVFNNAGRENTGPTIAEADAVEFQRLIDLNLKAVYNVLRHGPARMADGGAIVNTASLAATLHVPGYAQYSATKAAVVALTRSAALELAPRRIRVNAICPGSVWSEMLTPEHPEAGLVQTICPLGRIGEPEEVAALVHYLVSDDARYVTGAAVAIDGGMGAGFGYPLLQALGGDAG